MDSLFFKFADLQALYSMHSYLDKLHPYLIDLSSECLILVIAETITAVIFFKADKYFVISVSCGLCIVISLFCGRYCMF